MSKRCGSVVRGLAILVEILALPTLAIAAAGADPDGRYRGELTDEDGNRYGDVTFRVANDGRLIKAFKSTVLSVCTNPDAVGGIEVVDVPFVFDRVKVSRNGRFTASDAVTADPPGDSEQTYELSGRLKNNRVRDGSVVLDGICASDETFSAKRVGR